MGVFGGRARSRYRRLVQRELDSPAWSVQAFGRAWVCPYCATLALDELPQGAEARTDAILDHLDGPCPAFAAGEGEVRPLPDLRRVASRKELRRRVKRELVKNQSWQLIDLKRQWFCPFCGEGAGLEVPGDRRMTEDIIQSIVDHVEGCYAYEHGRGQEKAFQHLKSIVKYANQTQKLVENVRRKLEGEPSWRRKDPRSRWICPYCLEAQDHIDLSSHLLMFENAPGLIAKHLAAACDAFRRGEQPQPLDAPPRPSRSGQVEVDNRIRIEDPPRLASETGKLGGGKLSSGKLGSGQRPRPLEPLESSGPRRRASAKVDSGLIPLSESDSEQLALPHQPEEGPGPEPRRRSGAWGRDGAVAEERFGTTLAELEQSGEFTLIDDPEVRSITRDEEQDLEAAPPEAAAPARSRSQPRRDEGRRRRWEELQQELATVRQLSPGMSGEFVPGGEGDPRQALEAIAQRLDFRGRGLELAIVHKPGLGQRGDFAEVLDLGRDRLALVAGGIAGDEPEGPLVAAMARNLIRQEAAPDRCPGEVLKAINQALFADLDGRLFLTLLLAVVDLPTMRFRMARAGLSAPLVMNAARNPQPVPLHSEGMILGVDDGPIFNSSLEVKAFELGLGDLLVVNTNGVLEERGKASEEFGVERFRQLVQRYGTHEVEYFTDKFEEYSRLFLKSPREQRADVCLIAARWTGGA